MGCWDREGEHELKDPDQVIDSVEDFLNGGMVTGGPSFETRPDRGTGMAAINSTKEGEELRAKPRQYS